MLEVGMKIEFPMGIMRVTKLQGRYAWFEFWNGESWIKRECVEIRKEVEDVLKNGKYKTID